MKFLDRKTFFIFLLIIIKINAGPAAPGCWMACHSMCLLSSLAYPLCMAPCIALCSATCFSENTLVTKITNQKISLVPISTIQIGDLVLTNTGFSKVISNKKIQEKTQFWQLKFNDNSIIEVTPEHPIFTQTWTPVKLLKEGTSIRKKLIQLIKKDIKGQRWFITTESGTITINGCEFGAFPFYDQNYESALQNWKFYQKTIE